MEEKISVIIPVYNVEPYLRKCLDSVIDQTYRNLEIIIVDDGSPDNCGTICDEYAGRDSRIQVIHKENGGLPAARNDALKLVTGSWISFVDSDDWCELDLYEKAMASARETEPDIVIFSLYKHSQTSIERIHAFPHDFVTCDQHIISQMQLSAVNVQSTPVSRAQKWGQDLPWDKLYRASLILDNGIVFAENVRANEDVIFNVHMFQYAKKVSFIDQPLYHWRYNPTSIGHKYTPDRVAVDKEVYAELRSIGEKYGLPQEYYGAIDILIVGNTRRLGQRCFFNPEREGTLLSKLRYADEVLHSEPIYSAFRNVDRKKLGKIGKLISFGGRPHTLLLYFATRGLMLLKRD